MQWYYVDAKRQRQGPFPEEGLAELVNTGRIVRETLVWHAGMEEWVTYGALLAQQGDGGGAPASEAIPADAGPGVTRSAGAAALVRVVDAWGGMDYAGFWIRLLAKMIDGFVVQLLTVPVLLVLAAPMLGELMRLAQSGASPDQFQAFIMQAQGMSIPVQLICFLIPVIYSVVFVGTFGGTPGKLLLNLRIVTADGLKCGYGRAFCRFLAEKLSGCICLIGYIMAAFDSQKRTLHDRICGTRVVKRHVQQE